MNKELIRQKYQENVGKSWQEVLGQTEHFKIWETAWLLAVELHEHELLHEILISVNQTKEGVEQIMSAISDFAAKVTAFFDRQDTAITDLQGDVKSLNDQIAALQNSTGAITPEDQALLDGITARASTVSDKLDALDALTPPVVPPTT